ncbi:hypothetical protein IGX29_24875, partial [Streptomyces sp. H28]|nr:hypothetical protein [Streptomyces sp. H28]
MRRGPATTLRLLAAGAALLTTVAACGTTPAGPPGGSVQHGKGVTLSRKRRIMSGIEPFHSPRPRKWLRTMSPGR